MIENKRDDKGRFLPGISGNPTGRKADGTIPAQPSPVSDFRQLLELAQFNDELETAISPVLGSLLTTIQPLVLQLTAKEIRKDNRILAIMLQWTLNRIERQEAKKKDRPPKDLNQLELEFEIHKQKPEVRNMFAALGINIDELNLLELAEHLDTMKNPLSALSMRAMPAENRTPEQEEDQKNEN